MALQLFEGQDISARYSLLHRIAESDIGENWLALDKSLNERIVLKVFREPLNDSTKARIAANLSSLKGLIHPNIARVYTLDQHEGMDYVSCQYISGARAWEPSAESFTSQWPYLKQLFDGLEFAHSLSLAHGHVHPGNLLIDDNDNLYITDFGLPPDLHPGHPYRDYLSPQIRQQETRDVTDDIYSVGCHLFQALTGRPWRTGESFQSDSPIPEDIQRVVARMLHDSSYERPARIETVREIVEQYAEGEESARPIEIRQPGVAREPSRQQAAGSTPASHKLSRDHKQVPASAVLTGFAILLLLAGVVFFLLPESEPDQAAIKPASPTAAGDSQVRTAPQPPEQGPIEAARLERLKDKGQEIANEVVRLQVRLEDKGVELWAPEQYRQLSSEATKGDDLYREGKYQEAINVYQSAKKSLQDLANNIKTVKQENIETGKQALEDGDFKKAIEAYTILTTLEPDNDDFNTGLTRAKNLEQVLTYMETGRKLENEDKLAAALEKYQQALQLDAKWKPASQAISRTRQKIAQQKFTDAMSTGFTALAEDRYDKAIQAFEQARKILPESDEPADALEQVALAKKLDTIEAHKEAAEKFEASEQWQKAIEEYKAALSIDNSVTFAQEGIERANSRLELYQRLDKYLNEPTLMRSDEELAAARKAIAEANQLGSPGPELKEKMRKLSHYVSLARVPVPLTVKSDNKTNVTVYKVGHLGRIDAKQLELYPGEYTIVGQREGYRDVQKTVTLLASRGPQSVYISCTEKI